MHPHFGTPTLGSSTRVQRNHFERQPIFCFNQNGFGDISRNEHQSEKGLDRLSQVS